MLDHFKAFGFLDRGKQRMEMEPLWPGLAIWGLILVGLLLFY